MLIKVVTARATMATQRWGRPGQKSRHGMIDKELAEVEARLQQDCEEQDVFGFGFGVEAAGSSSPLARPSMPAQPDNIHQNITWARREDVFPDHWWEPRFVGIKQPPLKDCKLQNSTFTKRHWTWNTSLIEPSFWYWSNTWIDEEATINAENECHGRLADKQTMWLVILLDFVFATAEIPAKAGDDGVNNFLSTQVRMFTAATHNM